MGERRGHPVAGGLVALLALAIVALGEVAGLVVMMLAVPDGEDLSNWPVAGVVVLGVIVLAGGLWCAWRVGTGRWGLRRRPTPPAARQDREGG